MEMPLSQNKMALIDDEDAELVSAYTWYIRKYTKRSGLFYVIANVPNSGHNSKKISLHRLIINAQEGQIVDQINGNGLDNRRSNLRIVNYGINNQNSKRANGTSKFKGVFWDNQKGKWAAKATTEGIQLILGFFMDEVLAANSYDRFVLEWYGPQGMTNDKIKKT